MRSFAGTTLAEASASSNRRQPVRQTRTNPSRSATNVAQSRTSLGAAPNNDEDEPAPGFCPAITHFTDSITALPKEMIRHYTMLKEVDAKIYGPEEMAGQLVAAALKAPIPPRKPAAVQGPIDLTRTNTDATDATAGSVSDSTAPSQFPAPSLSGSLDDPNTPDVARRRVFANLRMVMGEMLTTLDEKNHVMLTAMEGLEKQLARCDSSFPYIANEISEEARLGSKTHWAYRDRTADAKPTTAAERTRHATTHLASTAAIHDAEGAAARSEVRREALAARKQRNNHVDSDLDDRVAPPPAKKATTGAKGRKAADAFPSNGLGLGITGTTLAAPQSKRRKVEKVTVGGLPMERAMNSVFGSNMGNARGNGASPRDTPALDQAKKRGRAAAAASGTGRKRANTNASGVNSPLVASSPITGTFPAKELRGKSPAPIARAQLSRTRQNSTQSVLQDAKARPASSASIKVVHGNGNGMYGTTADVNKVSGLTGRSVGEVKSSMKESVNSKGEHLVEDIGTIDGSADVHGALVVGGRTSERTMKREDTELDTNKARPDRPPSFSVATRAGGKQSKTTTPINASFASEVTRPSRSTQPPIKRSHKKGAGIAAQMAAAAAAAATQDDETSSLPPEEDEDFEGEEPRYCYCNEVSFGEMVACDMDTCSREWFHLKCVGLQKAPGKNAKWYCDEFEWAISQLRDLLIGALRQGPIPRHVAFVMDGNRRFAKQQGIETIEGHSFGFEALVKILEVCYKTGVQVVTIYAFSIENFKRSKYEVDGLMDLFKVKLEQVCQHGELLQRYGACLRVLGRRDTLKPDVLAAVDMAETTTKHYGDATLNICFAYTGQDEIACAIREAVVKYSKPLPSSLPRPFSQSHITHTIRSRRLSSIAQEHLSAPSPLGDPTSDTEDSVTSSSSTTFRHSPAPSTTTSIDSPIPTTTAMDPADSFKPPPLSTSKSFNSFLSPHPDAPASPQTYADPETISEKTLTDHMHTRGMPPLDLLIRTSGVERLSDFMLWQCHERTEIAFLSVLWPEFDLWSFLPVLVEWQWRRRKEAPDDREREKGR